MPARRITVGEELTFYRSGGIVSFEEYLSILTDKEREKLVETMEDAPEYVQLKSTGDIDIEAGMVYLMRVSMLEENVCVIGCAQGGMRQIQDLFAEEKMALNNTTGVWEPVSEIID